MKIIREIEGTTVAFELTGIELYNAYKEQQFTFDKMDVEDMIVGLPEANVKELYHVSIAEFKALIEEMAMEMRRNIDKYDMGWGYARDEAIFTVLGRSKKTNK